MPTADPLFDERYRALSSRDARFDGQFIAGVHSTGIYCRPSCPAMTPRARNVSFYRTAAAAHEAGLRACKRCQPDAVPGSPDWNLRDDLASRAMRLIEDGVVEREGVTGLAQHLGYTTRHLTRVLVAELGAGPLALARAHRAQTARTLIVGTTLSIADVAFAAGFSSIRQFNDTVQAVYETTPTELRRRWSSGSNASAQSKQDARSNQGAGRPLPNQPATLSLRLPVREPFDGVGIMRYFADHAITGLERGDDFCFERAVRLPRGIAHVTIQLDGGPGIRCTAQLENVSDIGTLVARVRRMFDLDADSVAIDEALSTDATLHPLVDAVPGIRIAGTLDAEEALFRTLIGQQISVAAARTVLGRLAAEVNERSQVSEPVFPTAEQILEHGREVLRGPASRIATVMAVAEAIACGDLSLDVSAQVDEFEANLTRIPGVGPWTAGYLAMRVLGNPDVLLTSDLVILQSAASLGLPRSARTLGEYASRWTPWRSYAGLHLWRARPHRPRLQHTSPAQMAPGTVESRA